MIWALAKRQVASKNTTFKMADVEKLMHEAIASINRFGEKRKLGKLRTSCRKNTG